MSCNVAFIGLGVMGYPMAGYISKAGHNVTVYNRTKSKAEKWIWFSRCSSIRWSSWCRKWSAYSYDWRRSS